MEKEPEFAETKFISSQPEEQIHMLEEKEQEEEKEELQHMEGVAKHKEKLAETLKQEQMQLLKRMKGSTMDQKLKLLIEQAERYTHSMLADKYEDAKQTPSKKGKRGKRGKKESKRKTHLQDDSDPDNQYVLTRLIAQPSKLRGKLRSYQMDGLNWMINLYEKGLSGILADEMGLGKTIQTISLIAYLSQYKKLDRYYLVIVPKSCIPNWIKEFKKWIPEMRVVNLIARKEEREEILRTKLLPDKFDI